MMGADEPGKGILIPPPQRFDKAGIVVVGGRDERPDLLAG